MNTNPSLNPNRKPSPSSNQNQPGNTPQNSLRDALLQLITPAQVAEAEARALATLAEQSQEESPQSAPNYSDLSPVEEPLDADSSEHFPDSERHSRKCRICNSPDREDIDQSYIHWVPPRRMVFEYRDVSSEVALYRHALATGLYSRRRSWFQHAIDRIIEQAGDTRPSADAVLRAIRASTSLDEKGRWVEPTRHVIIEHHVISPKVTPALTPTMLDASVPRDLLESAADENRAPRDRTPSTSPRARKEAR